MSNPNNRVQCVLCTTILTKPERQRAFFKNVQEAAAVEQENQRLHMVLFQILKEHGGTITIGKAPSREELEGKDIHFTPHEDGTLTMELPADVIVQPDRSIIHQ